MDRFVVPGRQASLFRPLSKGPRQVRLTDLSKVVCLFACCRPSHRALPLLHGQRPDLCAFVSADQCWQGQAHCVFSATGNCAS